MLTDSFGSWRFRFRCFFRGPSERPRLDGRGRGIGEVRFRQGGGDLLSDDPAHAPDVVDGDCEAEFAAGAFGHLAGSLATIACLGCQQPFEERAGVEKLEAVDRLVFDGCSVHGRGSSKWGGCRWRESAIKGWGDGAGTMDAEAVNVMGVLSNSGSWQL